MAQILQGFSEGFQDFAVTASLDTLCANFAQNLAEEIGDWEFGVEARLREIYGLLEDCDKAFVSFTLLRLIAISPYIHFYLLVHGAQHGRVAQRKSVTWPSKTKTSAWN